MIKKIEGIIVSTVDYKENSKIINILTKDQGLIGCLAKGSKSPKSKLAAVSNVLCYGLFHLNTHDDQMYYLQEADLLNTFKQIRKDIIKTNYALFLLELSTQVCRHENQKNIYPLLIEGLLKINDNYDPQVITNIIELKFLDTLGIKPIIEKCVTCGTTNNIITISSHKGGYLCCHCAGSEYIYQLKTLKLIRLFYYVDLSKISKLEISDNIKKEINLFVDDYYERYSGLYLKSKNFLEQFLKLQS